MIHAFTSSAPNYVGKVRALCESLREFLPGAVIHWLVADDRNDDLVDVGREPFDHVMFATELEVGSDRGWLFQHSIVELCTAIKPSGALTILGQPGCDRVLYFDPDIVLFSGLDDLLEELERRSLLLTPHQLQPETDRGAVWHELDSLRYGVFNLGFLGLRSCPEAIRFLNWWKDRCMVNCGGDWRAGVFTDQKWINFAPVFFADVGILRSPRFNVAPWNISQRRLEGSFDEGFTVDGEALGFYHFTGFDSGAHEEHVESLRGDNRSANMLIDWYRARTKALSEDTSAEWRLGSFSNGQPIEDVHRAIYRVRRDLQEAFPDPFLVVPGGHCYLEWFGHHARKEMPELFE